MGASLSEGTMLWVLKWNQPVLRAPALSETSPCVNNRVRHVRAMPVDPQAKLFQKAFFLATQTGRALLSGASLGRGVIILRKILYRLA